MHPIVFVHDAAGTPLMPARPAAARALVKQGNATLHPAPGFSLLRLAYPVPAPRVQPWHLALHTPAPQTTHLVLSDEHAVPRLRVVVTTRYFPPPTRLSLAVETQTTVVLAWLRQQVPFVISTATAEPPPGTDGAQGAPVLVAVVADDVPLRAVQVPLGGHLQWAVVRAQHRNRLLLHAPAVTDDAQLHWFLHAASADAVQQHWHGAGVALLPLRRTPVRAQAPVATVPVGGVPPHDAPEHRP